MRAARLHGTGDIRIGDAQLSAPLVLGHEFAGGLEGGPRHGERVAVDPAIPCRACEQCLDGDRNLCPLVDFAGHGTTDGAVREYLTWPSDVLHALPDGLSDADGAMLEPLGVALHAYDLAQVRIGGTVAVIGCGPVGLCLVVPPRPWPVRFGPSQVVQAFRMVQAFPMAQAREGLTVIVEAEAPDDVLGVRGAGAVRR
jgi:L-iditol 2-dehydrogenase